MTSKHRQLIFDYFTIFRHFAVESTFLYSLHPGCNNILLRIGLLQTLQHFISKKSKPGMQWSFKGPKVELHHNSTCTKENTFNAAVLVLQADGPQLWVKAFVAVLAEFLQAALKKTGITTKTASNSNLEEGPASITGSIMGSVTPVCCRTRRLGRVYFWMGGMFALLSSESNCQLDALLRDSEQATVSKLSYIPVRQHTSHRCLAPLAPWFWSEAAGVVNERWQPSSWLSTCQAHATTPSDTAL